MSRRALGVAAFVAVVGAVWLLRFDRSAMPELGRFRDDAYYYFCIVRSLVDGDGASVSAGVPTNGFHLAWAAALLPFGLIGGDSGLLASARWLGLACLAAASGLLWWSLRREGLSRPWASLAAFAVAADPFLVDEAQNGQETAIGCAAMAILIAARRARLPGFVVAGVFAVAARSDLILAVFALALVRDESWRRRLVPPAVVIGCYAAWNLALAGHPLQDSAAPMPWLMWQTFAPASPSQWLPTLWWWGRPCLLGAPFVTMGAVGVAALIGLSIQLRGRVRSVPFVLIGLAAALGANDLLVPAIAAAFLAIGPAAAPAARRTALALLCAAVAVVALHWLVRWYPRDYYVAPFAVAGAWAIAHFGAVVARTGQWLLVFALLGGFAVRMNTPLPDRSWQESMVLAGRFMDRFVPPGATIGSFNSGILSWHRHGPVLNLDGVVDRPAFEALRAHRLSAFLDERGVEWLCDHEVEFALDPDLPHACGRFFGSGFDPARDLIEVARFVGTGADADRPGTDSFRLYRRGGASVSPPLEFTDLGPRPGGGRWLAWRGENGEELVWRQTGGDSSLAHAVAGVSLVLSVPALGDEGVFVVKDGRSGAERGAGK